MTQKNRIWTVKSQQTILETSEGAQDTLTNTIIPALFLVICKFHFVTMSKKQLCQFCFPKDSPRPKFYNHLKWSVKRPCQATQIIRTLQVCLFGVKTIHLQSSHQLPGLSETTCLFDVKISFISALCGLVGNLICIGLLAIKHLKKATDILVFNLGMSHAHESLVNLYFKPLQTLYTALDYL